MKKIISLLVCVLLLTACEGNSYQSIDSNKAMELIEDNAVVIDVRTGQEFASGYIDGAINIPVDNIDSIDYDKDSGTYSYTFTIDDTLIIVYCASGMRSSNAAEALIDLGYTNVYNLDGGLINWGFDLVEIAED